MQSTVIAFPLTRATTVVTTASRLNTANVRAAMAARAKADRKIDVGDLAYCHLNKQVARVWDIDLDDQFNVTRYLVCYAGGIRAWLSPGALAPVTVKTQEPC